MVHFVTMLTPPTNLTSLHGPDHSSSSVTCSSSALKGFGLSTDHISCRKVYEIHELKHAFESKLREKPRNGRQIIVDMQALATYAMFKQCITDS